MLVPRSLRFLVHAGPQGEAHTAHTYLKPCKPSNRDLFNNVGARGSHGPKVPRSQGSSAVSGSGCCETTAGSQVPRS